MFDIQEITLMIYGWRDDGARVQSWNPYSDSQLVAVDPVELDARLGEWNREIVDRRIILAGKLIEEAEQLISNVIERQAAVAKLSSEEKRVLQIRTENYAAQLERHRDVIAKQEALLQQLKALPLSDIKAQGLVERWWVAEPAEIATLADFEKSLSDNDDDY